MDVKTPRRYWQFRLRTLLWLMLCLAIGLGAYRAGFDNGYADRINQREEVGATFAASYDVRDVVPTRKTSTGTVVEFDPLIQDGEANVLPKTWSSNGGQACIAEFATNLTLLSNRALRLIFDRAANGLPLANRAEASVAAFAAAVPRADVG